MCQSLAKYKFPEILIRCLGWVLHNIVFAIIIQMSV